MMDKLFFSPILVNVAYGIIDLTFVIALGLITLFKDGWFCYYTKKGDKICYLANFTEYFVNFETSDVISFIASIAFKIVIYNLIINFWEFLFLIQRKFGIFFHQI